MLAGIIANLTMADAAISVFIYPYSGSAPEVGLCIKNIDSCSKSGLGNLCSEEAHRLSDSPSQNASQTAKEAQSILARPRLVNHWKILYTESFVSLVVVVTVAVNSACFLCSSSFCGEMFLHLFIHEHQSFRAGYYRRLSTSAFTTSTLFPRLVYYFAYLYPPLCPIPLILFLLVLPISTKSMHSCKCNSKNIFFLFRYRS